MGDNRIFNVNGRLDRGGESLLLQTLELAFAISGHKAKAWRVTKKSGLILDWYVQERSQGNNQFPTPMSAAAVYPIVLDWLKSEEAKETELSRWCEDYDHDGHNGPGWQVYCEDWGHVEGSQGFIGIKPACMWYGK